MIRAAFFDVDGTLVGFETHQMPQSTRETLRALRMSGVKTFLSTGRNGDSTRFLMDTGLFDGEILMNGQLCEYGGACVFERPISHADIQIAVEEARNGEFTLGFLGRHESFVLSVNHYVEAACAYADMAIPRIAEAQEAFRFPVYQLHCYGAPGVENALIRRTKGLTAVRWSPNFADVYPANGGKDRGMDALIRHLGLKRDETIAFGDGENDISMLEFAGIGVAMGNAGERVKACADYVTDCVDANGISKAVEHFNGIFRLKEK